MKISIYALTEPDNGPIRYIGQSIDPSKRYKGHLYPSSLRLKIQKNSWLKSVLIKGKKPGMVVLAKVDEENADAAEIDYIKAYRMMGFDLVNGTDGGDGQSPGYQPSKETRRKLSNAGKGNTRTLGYKHTEEARRKISKAHKGKPSTGAARKGIPHPHQQGENHNMAKMTDVKVIEARQLHATGEWTYQAPGSYFGILPCTIYQIVKHKTWKHL